MTTSGPEGPNHPDHVGHHLLAIPQGKGLPIILREAEINGAGEELPATVQPPGGQQFLGPNHPEFLAKFRAKGVLAPVASGQR